MEIIDSCRYQLVRKIADGGMGSVYEAVLCGVEGFRKRVALKMILEKYSSNSRFTEMFIGEAKLVADLVHQNIAQIYQLGRHENMLFMAMEYICGVNLKQFMSYHETAGKPAPVEISVFIISRICRGLEYAHKKRAADGSLLGIVHRDICPNNIMISSEGEVKIADFGIAKARNLMVDMEGEVLLGKIGYMSPEQFRYEPTDARSDLYSLCIVLYELLTGSSLAASWGPSVMPGQRVRRSIPPPCSVNPLIPQEIERILMKGLEHEPETRYQQARELAYDLEYFMYHAGYGPTIKTLETYMSSRFPDFYNLDPEDPIR
jgi:serine/threonine-protein kinase